MNRKDAVVTISTVAFSNLEVVQFDGESSSRTVARIRPSSRRSSLPCREVNFLGRGFLLASFRRARDTRTDEWVIPLVEFMNRARRKGELKCMLPFCTRLEQSLDTKNSRSR